MTSNAILKERTKSLRQNQTEAEKLMWFNLRSRKCCGYKFRRQVYIGNYIIDFVCLEIKLVIEIDGGQHQDQRKYDKEHKEKKREQDRKRRETTNKNKIRVIQAYNRKHHFPKLLKIYKGCQLMLVDCLKTKKLELHHRKYTKKFMDCVLLCQNCHKKIGRKR